MSRTWLLFGLVVCLGWPLTAWSNEEIRPTLSQAAKIIKQLLDQKGANAVTVGEFAGPPQFASATGTGMRKILVEELAKLDVRDKKIGALFGVKGQYAPPANQGVMKIKISLVDGQGEPLTQLNADVDTPPVNEEQDLRFALLDELKTEVRNGEFDLTSFGSPRLLAETLGVTMPFTVMKGFVPSTVETAQDVLKAFEYPGAYIENGSQVRASTQSPFFVQLLVNDSPQTVTLEEGHPYVDLAKGTSFQIRIFNQSNYDVSTTVLLDGVNSFAFTEIRHEAGAKKGDPMYSRWLVSPKGELVLKGWHRNNSVVDKFLVTDFENSATAKVGNTSGQGTITVAIQSTWRVKDQKPPPEEQPEQLPATNTRSLGSASLGSAGPGAINGNRIGFGDEAVQKVKEDKNPRIHGLPRAVIALRYTRN